VEHNCYSEIVTKTKRNMIFVFVANEMYGLTVDNLAYQHKIIISHVQQTYQYTICYMRVWKARQKVVEMIFNTNEASYDNLSGMLCKILERCSRSFIYV
jgi:hypothetical protein